MDITKHESIPVDPDVEAFSKPLSDGGSGPELDYDNRWLSFMSAKEGKEETQFSPYEPPNWLKVLELARELLGESRDLRLAVSLLQAKLNTEGFGTFSESLRLLVLLLSEQWATLNPPLDPDDGDPYGRLNALEELVTSSTSCHKDIRNAAVISQPQLGHICVRHFEYALERSPAPEDERVFSRDEMESIFASGAFDVQLLGHQIEASRAAIKAISEILLNHEVNTQRIPDFSSIEQYLKNISVFVDAANTDFNESSELTQSEGSEEADLPIQATGKSAKGGVTGISSRKEAVKAIDLICKYLEAEEPTNPATMLLKRARRLIDKDFIELVRDLAPDAASEVARVLGVNLSEYESDDDY